jgi:CDP-diacylglycerol--serine O-phosphatidyltransferase
MLPSLITLINGICGFVAIGLVAKDPQYFRLAGFMIFFAMIADVLDGRVARISNTTSSFGGQLDSMCDVISFGAAPAFLSLNLLLYYHRQLVGSAQWIFGDLFERFIWLAAVTYLCCTLVRLARFNVENEEDATSHMSFSGLPSPAGAGMVAALVMYHEHLVTDPDFASSVVYRVLHMVVLYSLGFITLGCGVLMVSRIRYPHIFNQVFRGKKPLPYLYFIGFVVGMLWFVKLELSLVICFGAFTLSSFFQWAWRKAMKRHPAVTPASSRQLKTETQHPEAPAQG